jgi:hypothetical protein
MSLRDPVDVELENLRLENARLLQELSQTRNQYNNQNTFLHGSHYRIRGDHMQPQLSPRNAKHPTGNL